MLSATVRAAYPGDEADGRLLLPQLIARLEHVLNIAFVHETQGPIGLDASVVCQKVLRMRVGESHLGFGHRW